MWVSTTPLALTHDKGSIRDSDRDSDEKQDEDPEETEEVEVLVDNSNTGYIDNAIVRTQVRVRAFCPLALVG